MRLKKEDHRVIFPKLKPPSFSERRKRDGRIILLQHLRKAIDNPGLAVAFPTKLSKSKVSEMAKSHDKRVEAFHIRASKEKKLSFIDKRLEDQRLI
ncbi:MAG: hypothetical protein R2940_13080 [Syntrophotaleaceae bacterium]